MNKSSSSSEYFDVIIVAAGNSRRFSLGGRPSAENAASTQENPAEAPKQLLDLNGLPVYLWSVRTFSRLPACARIVVATQESLIGQMTEQIRADQVLTESGKVIEVVAGGGTRQESVLKALQSLRKIATGWIGANTIQTKGSDKLPVGSTHVMIHDAARPLLTEILIERIWTARKQADGVIPGVVPSDTVKTLTAQSEVSQTLDRSTLRLIQTPQLFKTSVIFDLHQRAFHEVGGEGGAFDDAVLAEQMGLRVHVVDGEQRNIKITHPGDWELVTHWARDRHP